MEKKVGFSLLELSVVLIIISGLMVAIIKGSDLINQAKLAAAGKQTVSSPVLSIDGLVIWYETTLPSSFKESEVKDNGFITVWNNNSGYNPKIPKNAIQNTSGNRPIYIDDIINGLPAIRFDGTDDFMAFDGSLLVNSNYTVFIVAARRSNKSNNMILGGTTLSANNNFHVGYDTDTSFVVKHYGDNTVGDHIAYTVPAYSDPTFKIHSITFNSNSGKIYYENGVQKTSAISTIAKLSLAGWTDSSVGRFDNNYFKGDVAEIIIFNRVLSNQERVDVEQYLVDKYELTN